MDIEIKGGVVNLNNESFNRNNSILYQKEVESIEKLLDDHNNFYAQSLCNNLITKIKRTQLTESEKLVQFNIIIDIWISYLRLLVVNIHENWPFIYDSYNYLFNLLNIIKDYERITDNGLRLTKVLAKIDFAKDTEIAKFLESLSIITYNAHDILKTLKLIFIAVYYRKNYSKFTLYEESLIKLNSLLLKLAPEQRTILLSSFLNETFNSFQSKEIILFKFNDIINSVLHNNVENTLGSTLQFISQMKDQLPKIEKNLELLQKTIFSLQMIKRNEWAFCIVKSYCERLKNLDKTKEAVIFLASFIDQSFNQGGYRTAYSGYIYQGSFMKENILGFPLKLAKMYAESAQKFVKLQNKTYFVSIIKNFKKLLKIPEKYEEIIDFTYIINEYYRLIRGHILATKRDFWWVAFHRSIFQEGYEETAQISANQLKISENPVIKKIIKQEIKKTVEKWNSKNLALVDIGGMNPTKITIKLRIPLKKPMKLFSEVFYTTGFSQEYNIEAKELLDEPILRVLYMKLPQYAQNGENERDELSILNQNQFGKLSYLFLPQEVREFITKLNLSKNHTPEVYVIADEANFPPFEMLHAHGTFLGSKFSFGYRFKEIELSPSKIISLGKNIEFTESNLKFTILSIGDLNEEKPQIWHESSHSLKPLYPFLSGMEQCEFLENKVNNLYNLVEKFVNLDVLSCTRKEIENEIKSGQYNIIHFSSNLFYLKNKPEDSFFLTPDNKTISFQNILELLSYAQKYTKVQGKPFFKPLIIFNGRIIDENDQIISRSFNEMSKISKNLPFNNIIGILSRISNEFSYILQLFLGEFLNRILLNESIGSALLKANRQLYDLSQEIETSDNENIEQLLQETHFVFYGSPFKKLE